MFYSYRRYLSVASLSADRAQLRKNTERYLGPGNRYTRQYPFITLKIEIGSNNDARATDWVILGPGPSCTLSSASHETDLASCHREETSKYHGTWLVITLGVSNVLCH